MTARGTYNQEGENVYLWKNLDNTFEYVSAVGGTGATSETYYSTGAERDVPGKSGTNGINRQTGGGGSGSLDQGDTSYKFYAVSGAGASGTSYSGGSGGGDLSVNYRNGTHKANSASPNGGAGGNGYGLRYSSSWATRYASGGAGNPGGIGASNGNGNDQRYNGQTGTGAWTGSLIASVLEMDKKKSFLAILVGVIMASIIMMIISFGLVSNIVK